MVDAADVVVIGAGHNGLVAGAYLARAGLQVLVLEARDGPGGLTSAVEYFPGYTASMPNNPHSFHPLVLADLELESEGLQFVRPDPSLVVPFSDGSAFVGWRDQQRTYDELAKYSKRDAEAYFDFFRTIDEFAAKLNLSMLEPPPPFSQVIANLGREDEAMLHTWLFGSARDLIDRWFESEQVAALVGSATAAAGMMGPSTIGNVMTLLMRPLAVRSRSATADYDPRVLLRGSTGLPVGGMGAIGAALVSALTRAGGEVRAGSPVTQIVVEDDRVQGVVTGAGDFIPCSIVISAMNAQTTFGQLLPADAVDAEVRRSAEGIKMQGSIFKLGFALSGVPKWSFNREMSDPSALAAGQFKIVHDLDTMDRSAREAEQGHTSSTPLLWGMIPSVTDPTLAPPGKHVMSINAMHAPHDLVGTTWDQERDRFGKLCIDVLRESMVNFDDIVEEVRYWTPAQISAEYNLVSGDISHGRMLVSSMMSFRPAPGWDAYATPVSGLFLAGASTWPGGTVSGLPGRNAALDVLGRLRAGTNRIHLSSSS
jgi:phytoene dehydrogenase-like protein